jgi:hypothetical protein
LARAKPFPPSGAILSKRHPQISGVRRSAASPGFRASGVIVATAITGTTAITAADGITTGSFSFSFRRGN